MTRPGSSIVQNAVALFAAQLVTWALSLLLVLFTPRYLGPHGYGVLSIAFSVWAVAGVLATWGIDTYLIKSIARRPGQTRGLVQVAVAVRSVLFLAAALCVAAYAWAQRYPAETMAVIAINGLVALLNSYSGVLFAALQGLELMRQTSLVTILNKGATTLAGIAVLTLGFGLYGLSWVFVGASSLSVAGHFYFLWKKRAMFQEPAALNGLAMLRASGPYLLSALVLTTYGRIDVLVMAPLVGANVIGWYSAALNLYGTLLFMPTILSSAVFPAMARSHGEGGAHQKALLGKSFDLTLAIAVPLGLGLIVVSDSAVALLFGPSFAPSAQVLALMGVVLIFMYQNIVIGQFLISIDRQNSWTVVMVLGVALTVALDLVLVPWFQRSAGNGAIGGALSYVVTEALMLAAGLALLPRGVLGAANLRTAGRIVLAGLVMVAACWWLRGMFIAIPIVVGGVTYGGAVLALRVLAPEDLALLRDLALGALGRLQRRLRPAGRHDAL